MNLFPGVIFSVSLPHYHILDLPNPTILDIADGVLSISDGSLKYILC